MEKKNFNSQEIVQLDEHIILLLSKKKHLEKKRNGELSNTFEKLIREKC